MRAVAGEEPPGVAADDAPVPDRDEVGSAALAIDRQVLDHPRDVLRAARVLDVEEDHAPGRRPRALGLRRRHALGERALRLGQRDFGLMLDDGRERFGLRGLGDRLGGGRRRGGGGLWAAPAAPPVGTPTIPYLM